MSLTIKDGAGSTQTLKTGTEAGELVPFHAISGTVSVTASQANPVYVTGSTTVANSVSVTASQTSPVYVTGSVTGDVFVSNAQNTALWVTSSKTQPLFVISDTDKPVVVSNTAATPIYVTSSATYPFFVTSSAPINVSFTGSVVKPLSGSASDAYVQVSIAPVATGSVRKRFAPIGYIGPQFGVDATFDWSTAASGTVCLASSSVSRKSLTITNPTSDNLYIAIGTDAYFAATNGFGITYVSLGATEYSFIIYPSGTYFAEPHNVGMFHGGFMISGSNAANRIFVTETY